MSALLQSPVPFDEPEFDRLLSALVDDTLTPHDRTRLEAVLLVSAVARRRYLEFMQTEFFLVSEAGFGEIASVAPTTAKHEDLEARDRRWVLPAIGASLAVATVFAVTAWQFTSTRMPGQRTAAPAASISAEHDAEWKADRPIQRGAPLPAGPVRLVAGSAQVIFSSGALVAIHAPSTIEILGPSRMFLRSGRVTPYVPPSAKGFTIVSPSGEIVDFGTEFSVGVGHDGKTDVFVINGDVGITGGHTPGASPLHLTQGFAGELAAGTRSPAVTLRPLVIDHFDKGTSLLRRRDWEPTQKSFIRDGKLWLPIDGRPDRRVPTAHTILENDFSQIAGRRSVISFNARLPDNGHIHFGRWVALVIDDGTHDPPHAAESHADLAVMLSPHWKVGMMAAGKRVIGLPREAYRRMEDASGPFQVVLTIDDTPAARAGHGQALVTLMVNGLEFTRHCPLHVPDHPRISLHTHVRPNEGGFGYALIDDLSISIEGTSPREIHGAASIP